MLKINKLFLFCFSIYGSALCGMDTNTTVIGFHAEAAIFPVVERVYSSPVVSHTMSNQRNFSKEPRKTIKDYMISKDEFLRREAEKLLAARRAKVQWIDEYIRKQRNDRWLQERPLYFVVGAVLPHPQDALDALIVFDASVNMTLDRHVIDAVSEKNWYFRNLFLALIQQVENCYGLDQRCQDDVLINGKNIDRFMSVKSMFPDLPSSMQEYLAFKVQESYRNLFCLKECVPLIPHVLRTALHNSREDQGLLLALRKSMTLTSYEDKNIVALFRKAIDGYLATCMSNDDDQILDMDRMREGECAELEIDDMCTCPDGTTIDEQNWLVYDVVCYVKSKIHEMWTQ